MILMSFNREGVLVAALSVEKAALLRYNIEQIVKIFSKGDGRNVKADIAADAAWFSGRICQ